MFAFGTNSLLLALFFSALHFTDYQIGLFMTLTLFGDCFLSVGLTQIADRIGRRRVLVGGSVLMVCSGVIFAVFENFWILLFAAVVGVISTMGGDFGPFRTIEESMLSTLTEGSARADVLSWYVTMANVGSCIGSEASGRIVQFLMERWSEVSAYHGVFWIYGAMGILNIGFTLLLSDKGEAEELRAEKGRKEEGDILLERGEPKETEEEEVIVVKEKPKSKNPFAVFGRLFTDISPETRSVMYKLWFLLMVDSVADGMVPYTLTNYYMDGKFHLAKSTLGDIQSVSYFLASLSLVFAAPLSRRLGLINTMVFTHIPSSAAVLFFPITNSGKIQQVNDLNYVC
jgi:MFS family permease